MVAVGGVEVGESGWFDAAREKVEIAGDCDEGEVQRKRGRSRRRRETFVTRREAVDRSMPQIENEGTSWIDISSIYDSNQLL